MSLESGRLRERVAVERLVMVDDGAGGQAESWEALGSVWAEVLPTGGREALQAGALVGVQGWKVTIRHRATIDVQHRFVWRGLYLNIRSIADPTGRREALLAFCESGVAQ